MARSLIQKIHASIRAQKNKRAFTTLCQAITMGNVDNVRRVLEKGAPVNGVHTTGWRTEHTPLGLAIRLNRADLATVLISHGADPRRLQCDPVFPGEHMTATGYAIMQAWARVHSAGPKLDPRHATWPGMATFPASDQEMIGLLVDSQLRMHRCQVQQVIETVCYPLQDPTMQMPMLGSRAQEDIMTWQYERQCQAERDMLGTQVAQEHRPARPRAM